MLSFDIYLQRFHCGDAYPADENALPEVLEPFLTVAGLAVFDSPAGKRRARSSRC